MFVGTENLAWAQSPGRALARLALPITISTLSFGLMNLVSTLFVAHLGSDALAGVGLGGVVSFALVCFGIGLLRGAKTLVSQAIGAGRPELVDGYLGAAVGVGLGVGVAAVIVAACLVPFIANFTATAAAGSSAAQYLMLRTLSAPVLMLYVALRESSYGQGNTIAPMRASLLGNLTNIVLDVVLILGFKMGVPGAGIAAVCGQTVECAVLAIPARRRLVRLRMTRDMVRALWRQGLPTGLQFLIEVSAFLVLTAIISSMSATDAGAHQLVLNLINVSFLPAHALGEAASVLVGQAVGANRDDLVPRVAARALMLGGGYSAMCMVVFGLGGSAIVGAMAGESGQLAATSLVLLHVSLLFLIADSANVIARGVLRGAGDVRYSATVGIVTAWLTLPPLAYAFGIGFGWGAAGAWAAMTVEIFIGAALYWWRVVGRGFVPSANACRAEVAQARAVGELPAAVASTPQPA